MLNYTILENYSRAILFCEKNNFSHLRVYLFILYPRQENLTSFIYIKL